MIGIHETNLPMINLGPWGWTLQLIDTYPASKFYEQHFGIVFELCFNTLDAAQSFLELWKAHGTAVIAEPHP